MNSPSTYQEYTPTAGQSISSAAQEMRRLYEETSIPVRAIFNDTVLFVEGDVTAEEIVAKYHADLDRRHQEWLASPEGQEAERRAEEHRAAAAKADAEGILSFSVSDADAWQKTVEANTDPYGACAVRYAARWANYMERDMASGKRLEDIAKDASHEADKEGITGFMYGCAVSVLSQAWVHGEALRRWHNLDTQVGDEGERANQSGGVLNPALLTIS